LTDGLLSSHYRTRASTDNRATTRRVVFGGGVGSGWRHAAIFRPIGQPASRLGEIRVDGAAEFGVRLPHVTGLLVTGVVKDHGCGAHGLTDAQLGADALVGGDIAATHLAGLGGLHDPTGYRSALQGPEAHPDPAGGVEGATESHHEGVRTLDQPVVESGAERQLFE